MQCHQATPLDDFFATYPAFAYDTTKPVMQEFKRMCRFFRWGEEHREKAKALRELRRALVLQFNEIYGTDIHSPEPWRKLCQVLRIAPIPETVSESRKVFMRHYLRCFLPLIGFLCQIVKATHVNLVDLVDATRVELEVKIFPTINALRKYTIKHDKVFPKKRAKAGGVLKYLLRPIF